MKKTLLVLLLVGVVFAAVVRADDDGSATEEAPAEEAPAEEVKPKKANKKTEGEAKAAASGPKFSADIPLEALSALPVEPLSMDAAALKEDDRLFDMLRTCASTRASPSTPPSPLLMLSCFSRSVSLPLGAAVTA